MKLWSDLWSITSISVLSVSWLPTEAMETISPPMPHPVSPTIRVSGRQGTFLPLQLVPCLFLAKVSALNPSLFLYLDKWSYKGPCFYPSWQRPKAGAAPGTAQIFSSEATFQAGGTIRLHHPWESLAISRRKGLTNFSKVQNLSYSSWHFQSYQ